MVLVIGNNSNYCYSSMDVEEEIDTSSKHSNNNIKDTINEPKIVNTTQNNQNNNEDYKHLFDVNYNKDYYDSICNNCIENVSKNKKEYEIFIKMVSKLFDDIIEIMDINFSSKSVNLLKTQTVIAFDNLRMFSKVFDSIKLTNSIKSNKLLDNNNSSILDELKNHDKDTKEYIMSHTQLTKREKEVRVNKLVNYRELSPIEVLIYIQNSVIKLKAQTIKALEQSILSNNDNININNNKIIIEIQQILEKVQKLYYNKVYHCFLPDHVVRNYYKLKEKYEMRYKKMNWQLQYEPIKDVCKDFERCTARLDILHYNDSNLQTMFNNLHNKVIAALNKMINDNRLDNNRKVLIFSKICEFYSRLTEETDSSDIKTLFNEFNNTNTDIPFKHWQLKEFLKSFKEKLETVKYLTDRKIKQQIKDHHTLLNLDNYEVHDLTIDNYILIIRTVMQSLNNFNHIKHKLLVQCNDFLDAFCYYYGYLYLPDLYKWKYILKYEPGKSPEETLKAILLNSSSGAAGT